jgi:hypothetical protein
MAPRSKAKIQSRISEMIAEVEAMAKRLRKDVLKRAEATGSELKKNADLLRKRAASVAALVEKQIHQLRKDLEKSAKPKRKTPARKASPL